MRFCILNSNLQVVLSNLHLSEVPEFVSRIEINSFKEKTFTPPIDSIGSRKTRGIKFGLNYLIIETHSNLSRRNVTNVANGIIESFKASEIRIETIRDKQTIRFKRLVHNIKTYVAQLSQSIYGFVPQNRLRSDRFETLQNYLTDQIQQSPSQTADIILSSLQLLKQITNEIDIADFSESNYKPDFDSHDARKVVGHALTNYWLLFKERQLRIELQSGEYPFNFDYRTIAVALSHMFSNIAKYAQEGSLISVSFKIERSFSEITFKMSSLKIDEGEIDQIKNEGYSGLIPRSIGSSGDGVGLYLIDRLMALNNGDLIVRNNVGDSQHIQTSLYENNIFTLKFFNA